MAATQNEIDSYITDIRVAVSDYGESMALKQRLGKTDTHCQRVNLMLLSGCLDCISDYFLEGTDYADNNFFTTAEIRDMMQQLNNICDTNYILVNL